MNHTLDRTRLHWQCRRGMLELDIMLGEFLEARFEELDATEKRAF
ncbi:MAG: succinate dehydrogenase assembly factor 2, partial [Pseudomonadota bacterium]